MIYPQFLYLAKSLLKLLNPTKVLDIGCAKGFLVLAFRDLGLEAYGVDVSEYAIECSGKARPYLYLVDIEKKETPFPNCYFDLITMVETIEHLRNYHQALKEIKRILKPGGFLYITTPNPRMHVCSEDTTHVSLYNRKTWLEIFSRSGLKEIRVKEHLVSVLTNWYIVREKKGPIARRFRFDKLGNLGDLIRFGSSLITGIPSNIRGYLYKKTLVFLLSPY